MGSLHPATEATKQVAKAKRTRHEDDICSRSSWPVSFWLSLIICRIAPAQQPPDNIEGNWTIYSNRIQDGAIEIKHVQIQQIGNRLEGYFEGPSSKVRYKAS